jgi:type I restriction enzyme S subunit
LTRQNKTLEDLAQAYFRKWFIEDASDEWEVGKLGDEFNITMGQSPKGETYNDLKIGLPFFQGKAEFGFRFPLEKQYCSEPIKKADKFDTLLSVRAPVGALNMAMYTCCIGRGLAIPLHKKGYKHYTFYKMKSLQDVFDTFDDDGTVFGSISREKFLSIETIIPSEKLIYAFDNFSRQFDIKIYKNTVQIRTLSKLRDTLLPKLISGEIRVKM